MNNDKPNKNETPQDVYHEMHYGKPVTGHPWTDFMHKKMIDYLTDFSGEDVTPAPPSFLIDGPYDDSPSWEDPIVIDNSVMSSPEEIREKIKDTVNDLRAKYNYNNSQFLPDEIEVFYDRWIGSLIEADTASCVAEVNGHKSWSQDAPFNMLVTYMHQGRKLHKYVSYLRWQQIRDQSKWTE